MMQRTSVLVLSAALLGLMGCTRALDSPPMTLALRDYEGRRAEGFVPQGESPSAVHVRTETPGHRATRRLNDSSVAPDSRRVLTPGPAVPAETNPNRDSWITSTRQGSVTHHTGDLFGTSIRTGDRTVHSIDGRSGTTHHIGRVSIHHFGDVTGMTTRTGNIQIHNFSDGSGGVTIQSGNRSITTLDR